MARVKPHRATPSLDMTPMVDLAFLLVTFFMLTSTARTPDPLSVDMPSSVSDIKIPEKNIILISMASDGRVFFSLDGKYHRLELINQISERFNVQFTEEEKMRFALIESFGVPVAGLKNLLSYTADEMKDVAQQGIPVDSLNNELDDWIIFSRVVNPQARIAIKGDRNAPYPVVKRVISTIQDKNINRFNLITNLEEE
ncbi:MAG TPA: biopolymer transporter ExbD [Cytophagales bacterium]|nr:biopolymer transporter ExbD [Cytophagales bacterium]